MSNLLEKASILTTATAYDDGKILSVKPEPGLGSELVTNGGFDTDSDWNKNANWSISGGTANCDGTSNNDINQGLFTPILGKTYKISIKINSISQGGIRVSLGGSVTNYYTAIGIYTYNLTTISTDRLRIQLQNSAIGSIDNVSVKEVIDGNFDFTRNSSATRVNAQGLVEDVGNNLPRIDYTGGEGHWLFEPQSTNLMPYSSDFSQSAWVKSGSSVESGYLSPSGETNASKFTAINIDPYLLYSISGVTNLTYSASLYIKGTTSTIGETARLWIIRDNVVFHSEDFTITDIWQRINTTKTFTSTPTSFVSLRVDLPNTNVSIGDEAYIWGAQLEAQSYSTSYIPTNGSTVTRLADAAFGAGSSDLINSTEGVLYINVKYLVDNGLSRKISISDGTDQNRIYITPYQSLAGRIRYIFTNNYSTQADLHFTTDLTVGKKLAFVWALNRFEVWQNGIKVLEDTSGSTPIAGTFNQVNLGSELGNASENFEGELKALAIFKEALTDAELTCLTTI